MGKAELWGLGRAPLGPPLPRRAPEGPPMQRILAACEPQVNPVPFEFSWSSVGRGYREGNERAKWISKSPQHSGQDFRELGLGPNMDIPDGFEVFRGDLRPESSD